MFPVADNTARKKIRISESADKGVNSILTGDSAECESSLSNTFNREESSYNSSGPDTTSDIMPPSVQETEVQTDPLTILEEAEDSQAVFDSHHQNIKYVNNYLFSEKETFLILKLSFNIIFY